MSDAFFDKFIADLVKGAQASEGFIRGSTAKVEISRENRGREEKLAMDASALLGGIPGLGPHLSGLNAAARDDSMGSGASTGIGAALGQAGGGLAGAAAGHALGGLSDSEKLQMIATLIGGGLGAAGGGMAGSAAGRGLSRMVSGEKQSALVESFTSGAEAAINCFGVKEAFLPMLGAIAGPMLARAGAGALARGAGGAMLGRAAGAIAPRIAGGVGGQVFDQAASMGGQALGQKLMPRAPQPPTGMG